MKPLAREARFTQGITTLQRKRTKQSRGPNQEEKDFQGWLKDQPCCVGGMRFTEVHHCKGSTYRHNKVLIGHWFCIPLAEEKHREYHSGTKAFKKNYGQQSELWIQQIKNYEAETGNSPPDDVTDAIMSSGE